MAEVLKGIRCIKFSAQEGHWLSRISSVRRAELQVQWKCFVYDIALITLWIVGPIIFSVISFAVHVLVHGPLTASVAFTTTAIFGSLESSMTNLADMISSLLEAFTSAERIDHYVTGDDDDREEMTVSSDDLFTFENAAIAYPASDGVPPQE